ncbi:fibronectin type III domain-containing protein [Marinobacter sp.]|uniref:fibronectin type III domain-containing protein n=1 Tax=Marinobacter sp. TaxID=50741 RepID=UPI002B494BC3|nr:fibronectin type III domain-containing protein [Marinobacter sp.]HKK55556.1 fibronectin type III domain-containing protein [Marinobacter sp.]
MKRIINLSKVWIAALVFGIVLTGCGGGSDSPGSDPQAGSQASGSQAAERSAALSWNAPGQRQNGDSLELYDLTSYIISYGQDPANLDQTVHVSSDQGNNYPATLQYTVENLSAGTWYFSVQAEDNNGLLSPPSEVVSKTIES